MEKKKLEYNGTKVTLREPFIINSPQGNDTVYTVEYKSQPAQYLVTTPDEQFVDFEGEKKQVGEGWTDFLKDVWKDLFKTDKVKTYKLPQNYLTYFNLKD